MLSLCAELLGELIPFPVRGTDHESLIMQAGEISS